MALTEEQEKFLSDMATLVPKYAPQYNIMVNSPVIAQALLESGWGGSGLAKYHNYFGLKCGSSWTGKSVNMTTKEEYSPGTLTTIKDNFRVFDTRELGVKGYFDFINTARYANLKGVTDPETYLTRIKADGYATSSKYVENLMNVIRSYNLTQYDSASAGSQIPQVSQSNRTATHLIEIAKSYLGCNEADGSHKKIIDIYNTKQSKLPRGYTVKYTDAWCATYVSAMAILAGITDILPTECGCGKMIELFQQLGEWEENEAIAPRPGYVAFYDWQDGDNYKTTDNKGAADHVGIVISVSGNTFKVIEGNYSNSVKVRTLEFNGRYLRGFGIPRFDEEATSSSGVTPVVTKAYDKTEDFKGIVTASELNVRKGPGVENGTCSFSPLPKGTEVSVCDRATASTGIVWYYICYNGKYGFVSSSYIKQKEAEKPQTMKIAPATSKNSRYAGTYKVTASDSLNLRTEPSTEKGKASVILTIPNGGKVQNYGYYTDKNGTKWFLVLYNGVTGHVSSTYLKKC